MVDSAEEYTEKNINNVTTLTKIGEDHLREAFKKRVQLDNPDAATTEGAYAFIQIPPDSLAKYKQNQPLNFYTDRLGLPDQSLNQRMNDLANLVLVAKANAKADHRKRTAARHLEQLFDSVLDSLRIQNSESAYRKLVTLRQAVEDPNHDQAWDIQTSYNRAGGQAVSLLDTLKSLESTFEAQLWVEYTIQEIQRERYVKGKNYSNPKDFFRYLGSILYDLFSKTAAEKRKLAKEYLRFYKEQSPTNIDDLKALHDRYLRQKVYIEFQVNNKAQVVGIGPDDLTHEDLLLKMQSALEKKRNEHGGGLHQDISDEEVEILKGFNPKVSKQNLGTHVYVPDSMLFTYRKENKRRIAQEETITTRVSHQKDKALRIRL